VPARHIIALMFGWLLPAAAMSAAGSGIAGEQTAVVVTIPELKCQPEQTGGFHDYPEGEEIYEPALFHARPFVLRENIVFMMNLQGEVADPGGPDLYVTLSMEDDPIAETTELECRSVRGVNGAMGLSCVNLPPSEMLLINTETYRFTRSAVGGWTFAGAAGDLNGDSIFIEYGQCQPVADPASIDP